MKRTSLGLLAQASRQLSIGLIVLALAACGGGGGGSAPVGAAPPASNPPASSSLVPAAQPLGAVLEQSALTLRPLGSGMSWRYRGRDFSVPTASFAHTPYDNAMTLTQIPAALGVTEEMSNFGRLGAFAQTVRADGDTIVNVYDIELTSNIIVRNHVSIELRSPVQENDQYTVFERNGFDLGQDIDGDGRSESADVAVYRRVVGREPVDARGVLFAATVRVDTITRARVTPSGGSAPGLSEIVQSDWYAAGVGIVKRQLTIVGSRPVEFEEELVAWDGLTEGLGAMTPVRLEHAASGTTVTPLLGIPVIVPFDNHVLVFSRRDDFGPNGVRSNHVDLRGRVLATHDYPTVLNTLAVSATRLGDEAFLLGHGATAGELQMARFDSAGSLQSDPMTGIPLPGGSASLVELSVINHTPIAVGIGTELWVTWIRRHRLPDTTIAEELVVRPYDRLGNPLAGETIVRSGVIGRFSHPQIVANGSAALLGFFDMETGFGAYHYVTLTRSGIQPISVINPGEITQESYFGPPPRPVSTLTSSGIFWNASSNSGAGPITKAMKVNSDGMPVRAGSGLDFSAEALPGGAYGSTVGAIAGSGISSIPIAASKDDRIYVEDPFPQALYELGHFTPGSGAWAATGIFSRSVRLPVTDFLLGGISAYAYSDRLLYVAWSYGEVRVIVVWRRGLDQ